MEFGCIKYYVKATVDIPYSFDYVDEITLPVEVPVDFNDIQDELQLKPITFSNEKTVCCLCCTGGEISMNLQLEKNGFILGEIAKVQIEVKNMSRVNIEQIMLTLTRIWDYKSEGRKERIKEIMATETETGTDAHTQRTYLIQFKIPQEISIHNLVKCILIKETFRLRAEVLLPLTHRDLVVDAIVKLGHIPLKHSTHKDNLLLSSSLEEPSKD
ncbi:arrestin domain-containing protein 17-like [Diorhabda sublineata]|uniref:arrestin domain-containing protein 17-like n=1 Tax=Diorhabda sublineata TaxID=1163346 RepID=UPI0024E0F464|nr:arrestin domain-containing protein 17-like [Diorhabda sublineata]